MLKTEHSTALQMLDAPEESDESFLHRLEYEDPILKASIWLHKLIIHRIRDVQAVAPWYRGETKNCSAPLVSELLSQEDGRFCKRFSYYCRIIKKYRQGAVPRMAIENDHRAVRILIALLAGLTDDTEILRLLSRRIREFVQLVATREDGGLPRDEYITKFDWLSDSIVTICGRVSDQFKRTEEARRGERAEPATKRDVAEIVEAEGAKTRRAIRKAAQKAVKEIRTNAQSEYDRRGPSSSARAAQVRAVVRRLAEFKADETLLPASLRGKHPAKWIHQACRDAWTEKPKGYSDPGALYRYCHSNEETVLSLAGI